MNETAIPVVIFCGGKGTRLKEETEWKPKPLVTVGERPIVWHIMKHYAHYGFNNFILTLGYKGHLIKEYFLRQTLFGSDFALKNGEVAERFSEGADNFNITFAETGEETETGERLLRAARYINADTFMATYGDGVANVNIAALLAFHRASGVLGTITGVHPTSKYGLVATDGNNLVTSFDQKPQLHDYVNGGFMVFRREALGYLRPGQPIEAALREMAEARQLALFPHEDFWHCMDTYKDYEDLNRLWRENPRWKIWDPSAL
ncbi:glucose-1-phosphate cytidylyltransferase [Patescibacteria group bacterium]|nr:MAG: glucose-1-phosphate cytidylyltransferase [Patescibacteria group bacterium]